MQADSTLVTFTKGDMKYYLDAEFVEDGITIDLLSIAIVAEDGRQFYAENLDADFNNASEWVRDNVFPSLWLNPLVNNTPEKRVVKAFEQNIALKNLGTWANKGSGGVFLHSEIGVEILKFLGDDKEPSFWADYADYDWVVLAQIFGTMIDLPSWFPCYCLDIRQEWERLGKPTLPEQPEGEHHALQDARFNIVKHDFLVAYEARQRLTPIVDLLNGIAKTQPTFLDFLLSRIPAGEALADHEVVNVREIEGYSYLTMTGVISAIGATIAGDGKTTIASQWDEDNQLMGFCVVEK